MSVIVKNGKEEGRERDRNKLMLCMRPNVKALCSSSIAKMLGKRTRLISLMGHSFIPLAALNRAPRDYINESCHIRKLN